MLSLVPALCASAATTVCAQRRIRTQFAAINVRASRSRNVVVRQSLAEPRTPRRESEM
jgi:hypothetical protein